MMGDGSTGPLWESAADCPRSAGVAGFVQRSDVEAEQDEAAWPAVTLLFVLSGSMRLGNDSREVRAAAVGLRSLPLRNRWSGPVECLEVKLSPLDMFALSGGRPMDELTDDIVDLEELLGSSKRWLHDQLASYPGWNERFTLVRNLVHESRTIDHGSAEGARRGRCCRSLLVRPMLRSCVQRPGGAQNGSGHAFAARLASLRNRLPA